MNPATAILVSQSRTVDVTSTDGQIQMAGTGVILAHRRVLTCFHLLHTDMKFFVNGQEAKVLFAFPQYDLLLLEADTPNFEMLTFGEVNPGAVVFYVGNPLGHHHIRVMGIVVDQDEKFLYVDMRTLPGASGSGLWDREGNLVGIVKGIETVDNVPLGFSVVIPSKVIKSALGVK